MLCGGGARAEKRRLQEHNATSFPAEVKTTAVSKGQAAFANGWTSLSSAWLARTTGGENDLRGYGELAGVLPQPTLIQLHDLH